MNTADAYRTLRGADDTTDDEAIERAIEVLPQETLWHLLGRYNSSGTLLPTVVVKLLEQQPTDRQEEFVTTIVEADAASSAYTRDVLSGLDGQFVTQPPPRSGFANQTTLDYAKLSTKVLRELLRLVTDEALRAIIGSDAMSSLVYGGAVEAVSDRLTHEMVADQFSDLGMHLNPLMNTVAGPGARTGLKTLASALEWSKSEVMDRLDQVVKQGSDERKGRLVLLANHPEAAIDEYDLSGEELRVQTLAGVQFGQDELVSMLANKDSRRELKNLFWYCCEEGRLDDEGIRKAFLSVAARLRDVGMLKVVLNEHNPDESTVTDALHGLIEEPPPGRSSVELYFQLREAGASIQKGDEPLLYTAFQCASDHEFDLVEEVIIPDLAAKDDQLTEQQRHRCYEQMLQLDDPAVVETALKSAAVGPPDTPLKKIEPQHRHFERVAPFMRERQRQAGEAQRRTKINDS